MAILNTANLSRQVAFSYDPKKSADEQIPGLINALNSAQSNTITAIQERHANGIQAQLPPPGVAGRLYFATDTQILFFDTGSVWENVRPFLEGVQAARPSPIGLTGQFYFATDTQVLFFSDGTTWFAIQPLQTSSTWTPSWATSGTTGAITYTAQVGNQIRTGNQIQSTFVVSWSAFSGWAGQMFIVGFPTTTLNLSGAVYAASLGIIAGLNTNLPMQAYLPANSTTLTITKTNVGSVVNLQATDFTPSGTFAGSVVYPAA